MVAMVKWSWDELFAFLSRERSAQAPLSIPVGALYEPVEAVGRPGLAPGQHRIDFTDGSILWVETLGGEYHVRLQAAALPEVGWLPELGSLPLLALPSALLLLTLSVLI